MPTFKYSEIAKFSIWEMLACDIVAWLYHYPSSLRRTFTKNKWKGSRIQNLPSLFSVLGSSITWRDSHCSGRFAEAVRSFHFEMHILPFLLQSSDLKPAIGTVSLTYSDIGLSCSPENIHSCEVTCIFCLLWGNVLVKCITSSQETCIVLRCIGISFQKLEELL